ncbi:MAG: gamma-glutamylcyclotransferase family protein [Candidatus Binataceae bacterium]
MSRQPRTISRATGTARINTSPGLLFVYGNLMEAAERSRLLGREVAAAPAILEGFERGRSRHYFVIRKSAAKVEGAIVRGLGPRDFEILDEYEEVPGLYTRERIEAADTQRRIVRCWIYLPTGWEQGG